MAITGIGNNYNNSTAVVAKNGENVKRGNLKVLNDISSQYGENVIVQFSGDGLAALADSKKFMSGRKMTAEEAAAKEARDAAFQSEIKHYDKSANYLPAYSGMYGADKAIRSEERRGGKEC